LCGLDKELCGLDKELCGLDKELCGLDKEFRESEECGGNLNDSTACVYRGRERYLTVIGRTGTGREIRFKQWLNRRVGTLIVATIYLQLIQNRYMFRSFTVLQCSHQHCVSVVNK